MLLTLLPTALLLSSLSISLSKPLDPLSSTSLSPNLKSATNLTSNLPDYVCVNNMNNDWYDKTGGTAAKWEAKSDLRLADCRWAIIYLQPPPPLTSDDWILFYDRGYPPPSTYPRWKSQELPIAVRSGMCTLVVALRSQFPPGLIPGEEPDPPPVTAVVRTKYAKFKYFAYGKLFEHCVWNGQPGWLALEGEGQYPHALGVYMLMAGSNVEKNASLPVEAIVDVPPRPGGEEEGVVQVS